MNDSQLVQYAFEEGFSDAAVVETAQIPVDPMFRPFCAENLCGKYAVNYSCPPDCGTPEQMHQRLLSRRRALVLQSVWEISDLTDNKAIRSAKGQHNAAAIRLAKRLRDEGVDGFIVGASGCALCDPCEIVHGRPCAHPDLQYSCMSAYCVFVRELTEKCGIDYDCGTGLLTFFGMYVCD